WPLRLARELDDAILDIRANEFDTAAIIFKSSGDPAQVLAYDQFLEANKTHWLAREIRALWKRVLKRVDLTSRSLVALIQPGSRARLGERPLLYACPPPSPPRERGRVREGARQQAAREPCARRGQFRRIPDVERALAPREPLSRRGWRARESQARHRRNARC